MAISATINGEATELPREMTVTEFLMERGLTGRRLAVAHNGSVVRLEQYDEVHVRDGDTLEVVRAVGGG